MSPFHPYLHPSSKRVQCIEQALFRLHQLLSLVEGSAAPSEIVRAERSYRRSLKELDVSERELVRHYPKYRFAVLARRAAAKVATSVAAVLPNAELN